MATAKAKPPKNRRCLVMNQTPKVTKANTNRLNCNRASPCSACNVPNARSTTATFVETAHSNSITSAHSKTDQAHRTANKFMNTYVTASKGK